MRFIFHFKFRYTFTYNLQVEVWKYIVVEMGLLHLFAHVALLLLPLSLFLGLRAPSLSLGGFMF